MRTFLARNVPDDDEMLVRLRGVEARNVTKNRYGEEFLDDPDYQAAVRDLLAEGGTVEVQDSAYGEVWVTAVPVQSATSESALVIINFLEDEHAELRSTLQTYAIVAVLSLGIITLIAARTSGRLLAPLRTVRETARDISTTDLSRRIPETGNDDITALTRTFNEMLARLEDGVEAQRRFLDDAGHELRTPLTVLRGHLELLETDNPADVERTRALLVDEVDRMNRLVGDLILLAKSRRPDFVQPHPVELGDLTVSLVDKARALGDRQWELDETGTAGCTWTSSGSPRPSSSSPTTRSSTPTPACGSASARSGVPTPCGSGCRTPAPASAPRIATGSSNGSGGAPSGRATRASASACPSCAPSSTRTEATSTSTTREPHGARFEVVLPVYEESPAPWPAS